MVVVVEVFLLSVERDMFLETPPDKFPKNALRVLLSEFHPNNAPTARSGGTTGAYSVLL